jgi:hypothetical protein
LDELQKKLNNFSFRVTKDECLDLPDKVFVRREIELGRLAGDGDVADRDRRPADGEASAPSGDCSRWHLGVLLELEFR